MLENHAIQLTKEDWSQEPDTKPKLGALRLLRKELSHGVGRWSLRGIYRRVMMLLTGKTAPFKARAPKRR